MKKAISVLVAGQGRWVVFLLAVVLAAGPQNVFARSFLWSVSSPAATVFLLGSIHLAKPDLYPLAPEIEQAFEHADKLVVEANLSAAGPDFQLTILQDGLYPGDETIADHVDPETLTLLKNYLAKNELPFESMAKMRPGMLLLTLTSLKMMSLGYSPELGIDVHFIRKARQQNKPILELESLQQQLALVLGFDNDDLLLKHTLYSLDQMGASVEELFTAWKTGNAARINALMREDVLTDHPEFKPVMKRMITDRNIAMAARISEFLQAGGRYFVVVGAGHLVGSDGILALLRQQGFSIRQH